MAAATAVVGLGLAFWFIPLGTGAVGDWFATPPGAEGVGPPRARPGLALPTRRHARPPAVAGVVPVLASASLVSGLGSGLSARSSADVSPAHAPDPVSEPSPGAAPTASLLPSSARDLAADGLPAAATHCRWEGGTFKCGGCQSSADCAQNEGCLINRETRRLECLASECEEDAHCFPGTTCRELKTGTSNAAVRRCMPVGERAEGESCDPDYVSRSGACREGLRCLNQTCTRPCQPTDPSSCPAGHTCTDDVDGPGCVPDCEQLGCPAGQQCKRLPHGGNRCLAHVTGTCPETSCGEGERCLMDGGRGRGAFWCARECDALHPGACAPGEVCGWAGGTASACFRQCDPQRLDSCGEGWMCATISEDLSQWGCRPSAFD